MGCFHVFLLNSFIVLKTQKSLQTFCYLERESRLQSFGFHTEGQERVEMTQQKAEEVLQDEVPAEMMPSPELEKKILFKEEELPK